MTKAAERTITAAEIAAMQADHERRQASIERQVATNNPSRRGYEGEWDGRAAEACIAYDAAFRLMQSMINIGSDREGEIRAQSLYDAYSAMCRLWDNYRRAKYLPVGLDARFRDGAAGEATALDAGAILDQIIEAESAVEALAGSRSRWLIRHFTERVDNRAGMTAMIGTEAIGTVAGLVALVKHFELDR